MSDGNMYSLLLVKLSDVAKILKMVVDVYSLIKVEKKDLLLFMLNGKVKTQRRNL